MIKLDMNKVKASDFGGIEHLRRLQIVVYVMCGGGLLGNFAATQPADFYIDTRAGKLPYKNREITQAVSVLVTFAEKQGLNPHKLTFDNNFHSCGIF